MRIVVCVKQVYDPQTVRISRGREELDLREAVKITNPADRYALEAALRLRSAAGGEVIALTLGDAGAEDTAHEAVAIGADRAMFVLGPEVMAAGGGAVARCLAAAIGRLAPVDLVITGQVGALDGSGSLAARLAAVLNRPLALDVIRLAPTEAAGGLEATVADGKTGWIVPLAGPSVAAIAPGLERPRYPHAARIANAWEPGLVVVCTPGDLGLDIGSLAQETEAGGLVLGPERARGQMIAGPVADAAGAVANMLRAARAI
jgi:electron transfer flavoprotein beta subunit